MITAEQVKFARKRLGLSVEEFAERLGAAAEQVSEWEQGLGMPDAASEEKIRLFIEEVAPVHKIATELSETEASQEQGGDLFSSFALGPLSLANRLVFPPITTGYADEMGIVTKKVMHHYERVASGGVGLVICEPAGINSRRKLPCGLGIWDDAQTPVLRRLALAIGEAGAAAGIQLSDSLLDVSFGVTELTVMQIETIIDEFVAGADRAKMAGFDVIELGAAHETTLANFLSAAANRRVDRFGGSPRQRARVVELITERVRGHIGAETLIGVQINGDDFLADGNTLKDAREIAETLSGAGIDYISVSAGGRYEEGDHSYSMVRAQPSARFPDACNIHLARGVKEVATVPVIGCGKVATLQTAAKIIASGGADMIAMGRALLCDPRLPEKAQSGKEDEIVRCQYCNDCLRDVKEGNPLHCPLWEDKQQ